jgi:hypothetical protein
VTKYHAKSADKINRVESGSTNLPPSFRSRASDATPVPIELVDSFLLIVHKNGFAEHHVHSFVAVD